jgi:CRISPR-associated protein Cas5h
LAGLLAGVLGIGRNAYYDLFSLGQARIGVALRVPVRRVVQTVGYLATDSDDWHGMRLRTQVPVELLLPRPPHKALRFQVYFAHRDADLVRGLHELLASQRYRYPPCLGLAACPAWAEDPRLIPWSEVRQAPTGQDPLPIASAVPAGLLDPELGLPLREGLRVIKDRMPLALAPGRELSAVADLFWEESGNQLPVALRGPAYQLPGDDTWFVFVE